MLLHENERRVSELAKHRRPVNFGAWVMTARRFHFAEKERAKQIEEFLCIYMYLESINNRKSLLNMRKVVNMVLGLKNISITA